jgi:CRISPR-associated endonuclease/helicase Cas3
MSAIDFERAFHDLTGNAPFPWLGAMYAEFTAGRFPASVTLPTGLGKTSVIAVWLLALASHAERVPRRLVYVVNRRTVVDQSTAFAEKLRGQLLANPGLKAVADRLLGLAAAAEAAPLAISTLRGQFADNGEWAKDPARPAVVVGTIDLIGSRLLFSGYRAGFKSRPMFAGFLGQDALVVHDEAHLEPAFQALLTAIRREQESRRDFRPRRVMALTATARAHTEESPFTLTEKDREDPEVKNRIRAKKRLVAHPVEDEKAVVQKIADLALAHKDSGQAVLIFVRTVEAVNEVAKKLDTSKAKYELLTGTIRGKERDELVDKPVFRRFRPGEQERDERRPTVYLICTAAGEVGVDMSADHLVCDLTPFDSMAQRFGRVNRYGTGDARIDVVHEARPSEKTKDDPFDQSRWLTLELLKELKGDASPAALGKLPADTVQAAFTPPPEILQASDILFDTWAMTTIRGPLPGRPPVADWLHGVAEWQPPETYVAWRDEVEELRRPFDSEEEKKRFEQFAEDLLDDYPLKPHELLRDLSYRVFDHLKRLAKDHPDKWAWLLSSDDTVQITSVGELVAGDRNRLNGRTLLRPPDIGGLTPAGTLGASRDVAKDVADEWFEDKEKNRPRRQRVWDNELPPPWRLIRVIDTDPNADEQEAAEDGSTPKRFWRWYVRPWSADDDGSRYAQDKQALKPHLEAAEQFAGNIAERLGLAPALIEAVALAARWHDRGKARAVWQRSIGNTDYPKKVLAKSGGKGMSTVDLGHYRHEFGSLVEAEAEFRDNPEGDLSLHLIAAHHGRGRPHFPAAEAFDPSHDDARCAKVAREVPRRFARLQRRFGRWGLAYLESLLRAADYLASEGVPK